MLGVLLGLREAEMSANKMMERWRLRIFGVAVAALVGVSATLVAMSAPASAPGPEFVLSSPDAQLAVSVPEVYTANVFGCSGEIVAGATVERRASRDQEFCADVVRS